MNRQTDAASAALPALPSTMRAWSQHRYGGVEEISAETIAVPAPGPGEVLVRVRATGLNAADIHLMRGDPLLVRLAFGLRRPKHAVRGMDVAGTVVALGSESGDFAVGAEVVGELAGGGLAPYTTAAVKRLVRRPLAVSPMAAAALPIAGGTAWQALALAAVAEGGRILVAGASGGVGTFAVQLAAHRGIDVWALTGARSVDLVTGLGASHVFDYRLVQPGSAELPPASFDAVLDIAGGAPLRALRSLVKPGGRVVLIGGEGGRIFGPMGRMLRAAVLSIGSRRRILPLAAKADPTALEALLDLVASEAIVPTVERTYPLAEAPAALAHVDAGHTVGKVVVLAE